MKTIFDVLKQIFHFILGMISTFLRLTLSIATSHPKLFFGIIGIVVFLKLLKNPIFFETSAAVIAIAIIGVAMFWRPFSKKKKS
jgi:uncharacterized membrane protein